MSTHNMSFNDLGVYEIQSICQQMDRDSLQEFVKTCKTGYQLGKPILQEMIKTIYLMGQFGIERYKGIAKSAVSYPWMDETMVFSYSRDDLLRGQSENLMCCDLLDSDSKTQIYHHSFLRTSRRSIYTVKTLVSEVTIQCNGHPSVLWMVFDPNVSSNDYQFKSLGVYESELTANAFYGCDALKQVGCNPDFLHEPRIVKCVLKD